MSKHVLCVGAAVLDTIFQVKELPSGEGKILPSRMVQIAEGMASSAAFAIARLGGRATLWGAVGSDETGNRIRHDLARDGVDVSEMTVVAEAPSALSTILVDEKGDRLIVPFYDHRLHASPPPVDDARVSQFDAVLVDVRWASLAREVLKSARRAGIPAILDGDVAPVDILDGLAREADHIIFSEPAARSQSPSSSPENLIRELAARFPQAFVCITFGADGAWWQDRQTRQIMHQPALPIIAVDTLAAGDAFHGAFALAVAEGLGVEEAIRLGSVTAALKCKVFGGRLGMPLRSEAEEALAHLQPLRTCQ
ncbi:sugar kinase [Rhizobium oryzicola]|uniref:Sugar kinase n=1 Tax=Rhizobium oryzicola TaxID=1232668 RepID=A0ABT8T2K9_9HYPH|nr:sugar kinase [Rhizobium oryzicola]MDO1584866.1 sugar kinase [Rhizobium oryzicola]